MNGYDKDKTKIEPHKMPVAYIAGSINDMSSDYILNIRRLILWGDQIRELGFSVFVPGIDFLCGVVTGNWDYGIAFANSQAFLAMADIMFICPKWEKSTGTKKEIVTATKLCIPIYYERDGLELLKSRLKIGAAFNGTKIIRERSTLANTVARDQDKPTRDDVLDNRATVTRRPAPVRVRASIKTGVKNRCGSCRSFDTKIGVLGGGVCNWKDPSWPTALARTVFLPIGTVDGKDCPQWKSRYVK